VSCAERPTVNLDGSNGVIARLWCVTTAADWRLLFGPGGCCCGCTHASSTESEDAPRCFLPGPSAGFDPSLYKDKLRYGTTCPSSSSLRARLRPRFGACFGLAACFFFGLAAGADFRLVGAAFFESPFFAARERVVRSLVATAGFAVAAPGPPLFASRARAGNPASCELSCPC